MYIHYIRCIKDARPCVSYHVIYSKTVIWKHPCGHHSTDDQSDARQWDRAFQCPAHRNLLRLNCIRQTATLNIANLSMSSLYYRPASSNFQFTGFSIESLHVKPIEEIK